MWSPTHVQVTVQRARGLTSKGTNGVFVTIGLGKEKYQTSVKEQESEHVEWQEKCELQIPKQGNTAVIVLTALRHNFIGVDQFVGCVNIPLADLDVYERPKNKWYDLQDKHGKARTKDRGELEVKIGFSVKPDGVTEVSKKDSRRASLGQLSHQVAHNVSGSLASISSVDKKSFKKLAKSITRKMKKEKKLSEDPIEVNKHENGYPSSKQALGDADPGVISDDEFVLDDLSHTGSGCSLELSHTSNNSAAGSVETVASSDTNASSSKEREPTYNKFNTLPPVKPPRSITPIQEKFVHRWEQKLQEAKKSKAMLNKSSERIVVGGESKTSNHISSKVPAEVLNQFSDKTREELIEMVHEMQNSLHHMNKERKEMEDYIDNLLLRVMDTAPQILQNPYSNF